MGLLLMRQQRRGLKRRRPLLQSTRVRNLPNPLPSSSESEDYMPIEGELNSPAKENAKAEVAELTAKLDEVNMFLDGCLLHDVHGKHYN